MLELRELVRFGSGNGGIVGVVGRDADSPRTSIDVTVMRGLGAPPWNRPRSSSIGYDGKTAECNASKPRDDSKVFDYRCAWVGRRYAIK